MEEKESERVEEGKEGRKEERKIRNSKVWDSREVFVEGFSRALA